MSHDLTGSTMETAIELLAGAATVVVACHVNPDGDALGSALALGLALRRRGVQVAVGFGSTDNDGIPESLAFLPGQELIRPVGALTGGAPPDVLVTVDTGSADRLGPLEPLLAAAPRALVIDHHASNTAFGSDLLLDVTAASTTVIVGRLIDALGVSYDADIATCLYAGLVTDTGQFQYVATTASVHEFAARLLEAGVKPEPIGRALFGTAHFAAVRLQGLALSRACLEQDGPGPSLTWTWITEEERRAEGAVLAEIEGIIDALRVTAEAEVALVLKGIGPGQWMVSTRSKGAVDVGAACVSMGGGGHRFAAGATLTGSLDEAVEQVRTALR